MDVREKKIIFAPKYIKEKATAAFVSLSNRNSKDMNKASWLPAHVYGNGYVGIGSKSICSWVIAETREILLLFTIQLTHVPPLLFSLSPHGVLYVFIIRDLAET